MSGEVLLYSGGTDSLIAWYYLGKPATLYVDLGHRYNNKERRAISYLPPKPRVSVSLYGNYFEEADASIPGRNFYLTMMAAAYGYHDIHLVAQKGEQNIPDRSPKFFKRTSSMLAFLFNRSIEVLNPFAEMYKHEMVKWYMDSALPVEDLRISVSCFTGQDEAPLRVRFDGGYGIHCGTCPACVRKYVALAVNGIDCRDWFYGDVVAWGREYYGPRLDRYDKTRRQVMYSVLWEQGEEGK